MIYAYRLIIDGKPTTLIVAGTTLQEFEQFFVDFLSKDHENLESHRISDMMDHFSEPFDKFKKPVMVVTHDSEDQQTAFMTELDLEEVQSMKAIDMQAIMIHNAEYEKQVAEEDKDKLQASMLGEVYVSKSIEELYGLDKEDPWDKRSEEEKSADTKAYFRQQQEDDKITDERSFGDADAQRAARHKARLDADPDYKPQERIDILGAEYDEDDVNLSALFVKKTGGEVDESKKELNEKTTEIESEKKEKEPEKKVFSPDDFAAALAGNGSSTMANIENKHDAVEKPEFSEEAQKARDELAAEKARIKKEHEDQERDKKYEQQLEEHKKGKFTSYVADVSEIVPVDTLPRNIQSKIDSFDKEDESLPKTEDIVVFDYAPNAILGGFYLLPVDSTFGIGGCSILASSNIEIDEVIDIGGPTVNLAKKDDSIEMSYVLYGRRKRFRVLTDDGETKEVEKMIFFVVRIR